MNGLKNIYSDYRKTFRSYPIRWWIVTAIEIAVYLFTGMFSKADIRRTLAIFGAALFVITSALVTLNVLFFECGKFKKRLNALPESEQNAVLEQYEKAPALGKRRFLEEYLIYFGNMKIIAVKYSEIKSAELKGYKLLLDTGKKKPLKMPFEAEENPAVLVAAMRSRNPNISVILNGKIVEKMENNK